MVIGFQPGAHGIATYTVAKIGDDLHFWRAVPDGKKKIKSIVLKNYTVVSADQNGAYPNYISTSMSVCRIKINFN